jgi:iron complex outermembrane receptor protein
VDLPGHWELDLLLRRVSSLPLPFVPAYLEFDAHLGWQPFPAWEFALVGQNLLHRRHAEYGSGRQVERSVYAKVTWRF